MPSSLAAALAQSLQPLGFQAQNLATDDLPLLDELYTACADYAEILQGEPFSPSSIKEEFQAAAPGRTVADKWLIGIVGPGGELAGFFEGTRGYPDSAVWWIGLLMLAPQVRGLGLGRAVFEALAGHVLAQGGRGIMLGVAEDNHPALGFWRSLGFERIRINEPRRFGRKVQRIEVWGKNL
jgi:ribosomal protein S18 acetylase RimI-like enzyme